MSAVTVPDDRPEVAAVAVALLRHEPDLADALLAVLNDLEADDTLDTAIWGPPPSDGDVLAATARSHQRFAAARRQVLDGSLTRSEAALRLGVRPQQVSRLVGGGDLVALEEGRELRLPAWQFHPDAPKSRLDGIREVAGRYAGGVVTLSQWAVRPNPALNGRTPAEALVHGETRRVAAAAMAGA